MNYCAFYHLQIDTPIGFNWLVLTQPPGEELGLASANLEKLAGAFRALKDL